MKLKRLTIKSAFSLVELLVVIAIIGVLAALLVPVLLQAKRKAQQVQCIGNLHQLGLGLQNFVVDNHAYPSLRSDTNDASLGLWNNQLEHGGFDISKPPKNFWTKGVWLCPSAKWSGFSKNYPISCYGYNVDFFDIYLKARNPTNQFGLQGRRSPKEQLWIPIAESEVAVPSDMMAIGESLDGSSLLAPRILTEAARFGNMLTRHQGKANVVFCDGHVESPTLKFLFEDTSDAALVRWNRDHLPHREKL